MALLPATAQADAPAGCHKAHTRAEFHHVARKVYTHGNAVVSRWERRLVRHVIHCQGSARARASRHVKGSARWHLVRYKRAHRARFYWQLERLKVLGLVNGVLRAIAACESGGSPTAIGGGGTYRGKYQFDRATWGTVGGSGDPAAASEAEQDVRAAWLYQRRGGAPWPNCP